MNDYKSEFIDISSTDQELLTKYECQNKNVILVETSYSQILKRLVNNEVDAAIWNIDEIEEKRLKFNTFPLSIATTQKLKNSDTIAAIVVKRDSKDLEKILEKYACIADVEDIQYKVMTGELTSCY